MLNYAIVGASGLIGGHILSELLNDPKATVTVIARRRLDLSDPRVAELMVDFSNQEQLNNVLKGFDAVFVTIGTTQKQVKGDLAAYRKVDYDIPISVANACAYNCISSLAIVSSIGANSQSRNFYLRIKGEVEDAITKTSIPYIGIFQPSLLLGQRNETRIGERISQLLLPIISPLLPPKYRPISALNVARAMIREVNRRLTGIHRYTYREMRS